MEPFATILGVVAPLNRVNVDTDQIIPKQFLKRVERTGFGQFLFFDWRLKADGSPNRDFILNKPGYEGASILVAGRNFGSGSSREHAPWALADYGFRCLIAPSFADIFSSNCYQHGILSLVLPAEMVQRVMGNVETTPGYSLHVDLEAKSVWDDSKRVVASFGLEPFRRQFLLNGLDDIGLTMEHEGAIIAVEARRAGRALHP